VVSYIQGGLEKTASGIGIAEREKAVLEILQAKGPLSGPDIAEQGNFDTRMKAAGAIAVLVRRGHVQAIPGKYRITEAGLGVLSAKPEQERKGKRKSKEPEEPSSQGDQPSP